VTPSENFQRKDRGKGKLIDITGWFQGQNCARPSSPPIFENTLLCPQHDSSATPCTELAIYNPTPAPSPATEDHRELIPYSPTMVYQIVDPPPFMPRGFLHLEVQGRRNMARFVVRREFTKDWAILSIGPLPMNEVIFANIREVSLEFLVQHKRVQIRDIQKTNLGQALV
jgi:hypothetical protein